VLATTSFIQRSSSLILQLKPDGLALSTSAAVR
jgi:hypothetical protein